ncbi:BRO family protein [Gluconobacter wancherniae]|uniref:BRO family protein n=1 Tax=Gluconobacter wancherniae TaxID=1307955 RepID=UPI001B8C39E1|nr:phage antirepressor KilAC domain-containing protein [Gluconobacter wancherniae]
MTEITLFRFEDFDVLAAILDGEPQFAASQVAAALGYADTDQAVRKHCKAAKTYPVEMTGQVRNVKMIPERDVYRLVLRSKKPSAEAFEEKVVGEILPAIRKTGAYSVQAPVVLTEREIVAQALQITTRQVAELTAEVSTLRPQAEAFQIIGEAEGELGVRDVGREVKLGQAWVTETLLARKWACKQGGKLRPAHYGLEHDYVCLRASSYKCGITGETKVRDDFKVTRKGINRLAQIIANIRAATQASASREMEMH